MESPKTPEVSSFEVIKITILGICIHILLLIAVFDTYFNSPLEYGMSQVRSTNHPVSKRVVIFVMDGLRAQAIFDENEDRTEFLTTIRKTRGAWGVSFAKVPTESRPNQVAIFAGIYEDPSAIYKSWREFPMDYDTVFYQCNHAWVLGNSMSVRLFGKPKEQERKNNNITLFSAPLALEYFKEQNQTVPDQCVADKMAHILRTEKNQPRLLQERNLFALFMTGLDMTGHTLKPTSKEYVDHLKYIDRLVNEMEALVENTFKDNLTTFLFTSDHGMTDWGSHGAGSEHEVSTPFIAWGAGIKIDAKRRDVRQIDIAPLISALLGLNYPVNSVGKIPLHLFDLPPLEKIELITTNVKQVFKIFEVKQEKLKNRTAFYAPFLTESRLKYTIEQVISDGSKSPEQKLEELDQMFDRITRDIEHFNDFFVFTILFCVALGLVLWIMYLATFLVPHVEEPPSPINNNIPEVILILSSVFLVSLCFFHSFSLMYYFYIMFPNLMFYLLLRERHKVPHIFPSDLNLDHLWILTCTSLYILVFILSFHKRIFFSLMMIMISPLYVKTNNHKKGMTWFLLCLVLAVFPLLPVMLTDFQMVQFVIGYIAWNYLSLIYVFNNKKPPKLEHRRFTSSLKTKIIFIVQNVCFNGGFLLALHSVSNSLSSVRCFCWIFFLLPVILIPFSEREGITRVLTIFMAFGAFYIMTTMSFELIFLTFYTILLIVWMENESGSNDSGELLNKAPDGNFGNCVIFVALILIGYFGTGNIVSISSFDPMWVRCFVISYSPISIMFLILLKQTIPFLYTTCAFRKIALNSRMNLTVSFCTILLLSDIMVFCFMFSIRNTGSWAEMGTSITRFVIAECFAVGILFFYFVAFVLSDVNVSFVNEILDKIR